jgi:hypothetical protein
LIIYVFSVASYLLLSTPLALHVTRKAIQDIESFCER